MPEFVLMTDPEKNVVFVSDKLGEESVTITLKLTNTAPKDVVFKVKCTSNEMFRIRPPMGILPHMKCENIRLVFNAGKNIPENRKHYFAVYYIFKPDDEAAASKSARELWGEHTGNPEGTRRMYIEFKKDKPSADAPADVGAEKKDDVAAAAAGGGEKKEGGEEKKDVAAATPVEGAAPKAEGGGTTSPATGTATLAEAVIGSGSTPKEAAPAKGEKKEGGGEEGGGEKGGNEK